MMKVVMLTYSTKARGGVAHALKLSEHLRGIGVDVSLHTLMREDVDEAEEFYRDTTTPYMVHRFKWEEDVTARLQNMIRSYTIGIPKGADVYHAQDCVGGTALQIMKGNGELSAPTFRTVHHIDDFAEPRLFEFEKRAVDHADRLFVVSNYWQEVLRRDYNRDSVVAHNGIDLGDFDNIPERRSTAPTILFVGGLEPRKGLEFLVLLISEIRKAHPDVRLSVVAKAGFRGVDSVEWFEHLADRARVQDAIEFHESISQHDLVRLYADADVVVLPSRDEGWGLSLMEAMACGLPIVASRVGGVPELVRDGQDGLLVESGDVVGLGHAIARLLSDPEMRRRMGSSGRKRVEGFSWDDTARVTSREYERALSPSH
ncbi:MAG: glycosyltransferase [Methanobacteriota archaeon]|nr:MAG: glycosyltransferase [Euryarchaeota archaeon]